MPSLYFHPGLEESMREAGIIDRFVRGFGGTYEHRVTLRATTGPDGVVGWVLCIELCDQSDVPLMSVPLGGYVWAKPNEALSDADLVARTLGLALRVADLARGWRHAYDPDGPRVLRAPVDARKLF